MVPGFYLTSPGTTGYHEKKKKTKTQTKWTQFELHYRSIGSVSLFLIFELLVLIVSSGWLFWNVHIPLTRSHMKGMFSSLERYIIVSLLSPFLP